MRIVRYTQPTNRFAPASVFGRNPWSGLETEIDRLFQSALSDFGGAPAADRFPVDLYEDDHSAFVRAELPGFKRDAISVEVVDGYLTIAATRETKQGEKTSTAKFNRSVALPDEVKADGVTAAYENGVLTVTLPKKEEAKPRKITVAVK
ncbi:Hsp20/alpha crystallin family protein [Synoicihabitans lomoniglobus]|uniref:Hsp20/alpha crystallin family protein n=1 Tax=Synoicihabitans lomoniglobus TaxID=2909285 RepID=A0AAE9ZVM8_9BACT|nr:Hsp20/alpha crystallin family protein [Opitutaceae bacterium LMO-M01]WED64996.1 Hsp20/alpha crystallin family protein [Opitutaceae bacterium LMO-M01]